MTNGTWSYKLRRNIGFGLVSVQRQIGDRVQVLNGGSIIDATLVALPFREDDR